jgi:hypothetical protein
MDIDRITLATNATEESRETESSLGTHVSSMLMSGASKSMTASSMQLSDFSITTRPQLRRSVLMFMVLAETMGVAFGLPSP